MVEDKLPLSKVFKNIYLDLVKIFYLILKINYFLI